MNWKIKRDAINSLLVTDEHGTPIVQLMNGDNGIDKLTPEFYEWVKAMCLAMKIKIPNSLSFLR